MKHRVVQIYHQKHQTEYVAWLREIVTYPFNKGFWFSNDWGLFNIRGFRVKKVKASSL